MACCSQLVTPAAYANAADAANAVVPMRFPRTRLNSQFVTFMLAFTTLKLLNFELKNALVRKQMTVQTGTNKQN